MEQEYHEPKPDHRRERRFLCLGNTRIVDCATGRDLGIGILRDISPSGACLYVFFSVPAATIVELRQGNRVFRGEIRYCVGHGEDYRLGVQFIPPEQWSGADDWPALS